MIIQNFDLQEVGSNSGAFWSVVQDHRGVIYIGGEEAVFEFDGTSWRSIYLPNRSVVRSLAIDEKGTIFVGGVSEFGYLTPDSIGNTRYVSLLDEVENDKRDFPDIWSVNTLNNTVFFQSADRLFVYKDEEIRTIELKNSYHRSFVIDGNFILNQEEIGLCYLQDEEFFLMEGGAFFRNMVISSLTLFDRGRFLVGTRRNGLFIYDPSATVQDKVVPLVSEASDFLKNHQLYHGIALPDNRYAFSSLRNGTIIMNRKGDIQELVNKSAGTSDYSAYYLMLSNDYELWITSGNGISLYNINSAMNYWDEELGLKGSINSILEYKNKVYIATYSGLYTLNSNAEREHRDRYQMSLLEQHRNLESEVWDMLVFNPEGVTGTGNHDQLLVATGQGLYNVEKQTLIFETGRVGAITMFQSRINPTILYLNAHPKFYVLQYVNGRWHPLWEKHVSSYVVSIVEDPEGSVWLGTQYYGLFKIDLQKFLSSLGDRQYPGALQTDSSFRNISIEHFDQDNGLPGLTKVKAHLLNGQLMVTGEGILTFDPKSEKFEKAAFFGEEVRDLNIAMEDFEVDASGNIWGAHNQILARHPDGQYQVVSLPYKMLTARNATICYYHDKRGATWIGGGTALLRYESNAVQTNARKDFVSLIRTVKIGRDSVIFGGAYSDTECKETAFMSDQPELDVPDIKYKKRTISFEYACPYFRDDISLEYSYMLEGYENEWSPWSSQTSKEYSNLREKDYTFHVRARNYSGEISKEASYRFVITPPWQRTMLFFVVLALLILTISYFSVKIYVKRLRESNIKLEKLVSTRTAELELQKEEIHSQAEKLRSQNEKLTLQRNRMSEMSKEILRTNRDKLQFFTNISHELRTPLTLILGPIEELESEKAALTGEQVKSKYGIIRRNANRLLTLVNQILDFRTLEKARPTLSASQGNIVSYAAELTACFTELAANSNINLVFQSSEKEIITWFDSDKLGKMLVNLISNAFKYTNEGGKIIVDVEYTVDTDVADKETGVIILKVSDSGIGIEPENLPKIFDRYYHSGRSLTLEQVGSGIGLSMVASLAEIHHGKIEVTSELGKGSVFTLTIPFGESYLKEDEKLAASDQEMIESVSSVAKKEVIEQLNVSVRKKTVHVDRESDKDLVLLIDDSEDIRSYVISGLEKKYDFIEAEDGDEGLELAQKFNPGLIISDIRMPKMNGYELCNNVKSGIETSHIPVILLTSKSADNDIKQGLEVGADAYITKPFNLELLEARADNLIQSSERMRQRFSKDLVYRPADIVITSTDEKFLSKALKMVEENMANPSFDIDAFSKEMAMSQSTLYRKLKALTSMSTNNFIKEFRLKQAASIMINNDLPVSEVSLMVGFDDPAYFAKSFKAKFNKTPTEYAKENK